MKAILVIDMPDACYECPCYRQTQEGFEDCKATYIPLSPTEVNDIPEWCPLKPMPNKISTKKITGDDQASLMERCYIYGWNACLDEITGEQNNERVHNVEEE